MNVTVKRADLDRELALAASVAPRKPVIAVLGSVLLTAEANGLLLAATDLEIAIKSPCAATVREPGMIAVPAQKLYDLVRSFQSDADVTLVKDGQGLKVTAGRYSGRLQVQPVEDFPRLATPPVDPQPILTAERLRDLILRVRFACTPDDKRYALNGALLELEGTTVRLVATDGHRLAVAEADGAYPAAPDTEPVIVPRKTLDSLAALLDGEEETEVRFMRGESHLFFAVGDRLMTSRTIVGQFPGYRRIIPKSFAASVEVPRSALLGTARRALLTAENNSRRVTVALALGALTLAAKSADVGDGQDSLDAVYDGAPLTVYVNGDYVADFLEAAVTEQVALRLNTATSAIGLGAVGGDVRYDYVLMPQVA